MPNRQAGPFNAIDIFQRGNRFLLCAIPASQLGALCGGLSSAPSRTTNPEALGISSPEDVRELVAALESSAFLEEVNQVQQDSYHDEDPYQRILDRTRAKAIAAYLQGEDSILPNGIILAANDGVIIDRNGSGRISIAWDDEDMRYPFNIIDGQHRVEGLKLLASENDVFGEFEVPAAVLADLPFYAQAELFATINGEQKKVNKSQIFDLLGYKPIEDIALKGKVYRGEMAIQRFCHHAIKVLNESKKSPWESRIKMRGAGTGVVTQAAFVDHLALYCTPKKDRAGVRTVPVFFEFYKNDDLVGLARLLLIYFIGVREAKPHFWSEDGALASSLFGKTNGIAVMFEILHCFICLAGCNSSISVEVVAQRWRQVDDDLIGSPPRGGSKGYQREIASRLLSKMFGDDVEPQLNAAIERMRPKLKEQGALI